VTIRGRHVVASTAAVLAVFASGEAAPAPLSPPPLLEQANTVRRQLGLVLLRADPLVRQVVLRMARSDLTDRQPEVLEVQPDCAVCDAFLERGVSTDPQALYRSLGGRAAIRFGLWRSGWSAAENLSVFFPVAALVLDPRARTLAVARTPLGMLVVGVTGDPKARFERAVRWPRGALDPRHQLWVEVVLPPGYGYPNLYDLRGGRDMTVAYPLAVARGFRGARIVAFGLNTSLAYGRAYHVGTSRLGVRLKTRGTPAAFLRRSWTFHSVLRHEREAFLDAVRRTPAQLRTLLAQLDGAVDVVGGSEACLSVDACEELRGERATVGIAATTSREVIIHELGHVVFDLALDERGRRVFRTAFSRTGWEKVCCIPLHELFADQLAHWALGEESGDPRWVARVEFSRLLREHASYRPLSARGLLPR
jgi:hypothetical protein